MDFLLLLPIFGVACSRARLYIKECFRVPVLVSLGLCLGSGANKSGVITALADIISGFEKVLLADALQKARQLAAHESADEPPMPMESEEQPTGEKLRGTHLLPNKHNNRPALFSDEGSLPAIGMQMAQMATGLLGCMTKAVFFKTLSNSEAGLDASTMAKLVNGSLWKRTAVKDRNRFSMSNTCLCLAASCHIEEWHECLEKGGALIEPGKFLIHRSTKGPWNLRIPALPTIPDSRLTKFVQVLRNIERAHATTAPDYDKVRENTPYFFANDALE